MLVPVLEDKYLSSNGISENTQAFNGEKAIVMDGMVMIRIPKPSGTYNEFSSMLLDKVIDEVTGYSRVDVVFDVYDPQSIKSDERTKLGSQKMRNIRILNRAMNIPKGWNDFLTNINNINELVSFLIDSCRGMVQKIPVGQKFIVSGTDVHHLTEELESCLSVDHLSQIMMKLTLGFCSMQLLILLLHTKKLALKSFQLVIKRTHSVKIASLYL